MIFWLSVSETSARHSLNKNIYIPAKTFLPSHREILSFYFGRPTAYGLPGPGIRSDLLSQPKPEVWQRQIPIQVCQARDQACIPALPRHPPILLRPSRSSKISIYTFLIPCVNMQCYSMSLPKIMVYMPKQYIQLLSLKYLQSEKSFLYIFSQDE